MTMATPPGDGKTNPFGNGAGKAGQGDMAGNDFVTKPDGATGASKGPGNLMESRQQVARRDETINQAEIPEGGTMLLADPRGPDAGNPIGTLADRATSSPFRLDGGG